MNDSTTRVAGLPGAYGDVPPYPLGSRAGRIMADLHRFVGAAPSPARMQPQPELTRRVVPEGNSPATALSKTVLVLRAFTSEDRGVTLAELCRRTGMVKGTAHRVCADMVGHGLLERDERHYRLGRLMFELGMRASVERDLLEIATPYLQELRTLGETVHLGVRDGVEVVYIAKLVGLGTDAAPSRMGGRQALHCTAIGKALLAHGPAEVLAQVVTGDLARRTPRSITAPGLLIRQLERVRETGLAFEYEESRTGVVCVGAPVFGPDGVEAVAAISIAGPISRFHPETHGARLRVAALQVGATLARRGDEVSHEFRGTEPHMRAKRDPGAKVVT